MMYFEDSVFPQRTKNLICQEIDEAAEEGITIEEWEVARELVCFLLEEYPEIIDSINPANNPD